MDEKQKKLKNLGKVYVEEFRHYHTTANIREIVKTYIKGTTGGQTEMNLTKRGVKSKKWCGD